jgi:hypothetical protein
MEQIIPYASIIKENQVKPLLHESQQIVSQIQYIFSLSGKKKGNHQPASVPILEWRAYF